MAREGIEEDRERTTTTRAAEWQFCENYPLPEGGRDVARETGKKIALQISMSVKIPADIKSAPKKVLHLVFS